MTTRTPEAVTRRVRVLCKRIAPGIEPVFVPVRPESDAVENECFVNLGRKVRRDGGRIQHGWAIWIWPPVLIEGEFHGVWVSPGEELVDVTPNLYKMSRILFLPDPKRVYQGRQVDNIRMPLRDDPLLHELLRLLRKRFQVYNAGERANVTGLIRIPAHELAPIDQRIAQILSSLGVS